MSKLYYFFWHITRFDFYVVYCGTASLFPLSKWWYTGLMTVVLIILSSGLLGLIIYFAISPKSSKLLKISAIAALALIALSIGICLFLIIKGPSQDTAAIALPVFQDTPTKPASKTNIPAIVIFVVILLAISGLIIVGIRRDKHETSEPVAETKPSPVFSDSDDLGLGDEPMLKDNDDSFDIDI